MLRDIVLIYRAELSIALRNRSWLVMGMVQPLLYLLLFGPLLVKIAASTPGFPPGSAWAVLTPGLIIQLALFNSAFAGYSVLADNDSGVLERLRVTPASRAALMLGRVLATAVLTMVQSLLTIILATIIFHLDAPILGIALTLVIAALVSVTLASCSNAVALKLKNEPAFSSILNAVLLPLGLLSGMLVPITAGLAPTWLFVLSRLNPLVYIVDTGRSLFRDDLSPGPLLLGAAVLVAMTSLAVWWGTRTYQRENI
jgi:ABC-2 type transport system permease protein